MSGFGDQIPPRYGRLPRRARAALLLTTTALSSSLLAGFAQAQTLPSGGSVAAGSVAIAQPGATQLTITQSSASAVVNWQSFSIGAGARVSIQQPDASSALLNRVTGSTPSTIAGALTANGQVYLVNPNGIAITPGGVVNIVGGFVASTLGISDADFQSGKRTFTGNGASAAVSNAGVITIGRGGYAALIGGKVSNAGRILVPLGKVGLGSGESAALDFSGDGFLQVAVPTTAGGAAALISNAGSIRANGGSVVISAATAREAARNAVNISGIVQARSIGGRTGSIQIGGGAGGDVNISGRLNATSREATGGAITVTGKDITLAGATVDASGNTGGGNINIGGGSQGSGPPPHADSVTMDAATTIKADATQNGNGGNVVVWSDGPTSVHGLITATAGASNGNGGSIETSGHSVDFNGLRVDTSAPNGAGGMWLVDPANLTIDQNAANTISVDLASTDITLTTSAGGAVSSPAGIGVVGISTDPGDIIFNSGISWLSGHTLTLNAFNAITVNASIAISGAGKLVLTAAAQTGISTTGLTFGNGASVDYGSTDHGGSFSLNGVGYTLVYSMAQLDAIDGFNAVTNAGTPTYGAGLTGSYALATSLNATGTTYTGALIGIATGFTGRLDGLGHTIAGLTISAPAATNVGLIGTLGALGTGNVSVSNLGLIGGTVAGQQFVGELVGIDNQGVVQGSYATGSVVGTSSGTGGLVGRSQQGIVQASYATGTVSGNNRTGGLVGYNNAGTVRNSYATGAVTGTKGNTGGLVGQNSQSGTVQTSYATGAVSGLDSTGGLVGVNVSSSSIQSSYATGRVSGTTNTGALVGLNDGSTISSSYWNTQTSGQASGVGGDNNNQTGNVIGQTTAALQGALPTGFSASRWGTGSALYPYLNWQFVAGTTPQSVSGIAYQAGGAVLAGAKVAATGAAFSGNTGTGANGYYYFLLPQGSTAQGNGVFIDIAGNATKANDYVWGAFGSVQNLDLNAGRLNVRTDTTALSSLASGLAGAAGTTSATELVFSTPGGVLTPNAGTGVAIAASGAFGVDQNLVVPNDLLLTAAGGLTIAASGSVSSSSGNVTLAGSSFVNNAGSAAVAASNGRWLVYSSDPLNDARGGLAYDFKQYGATYGVTAVAQATGNGVLYTVTPTTIALTGTVAKTYDGNTSVASGSFSVGFTGYDQDVVAATYSNLVYGDVNAGTGKAVTASGVTVTSASNGSAIVYGYSSTTTTASGNIGTITARPLAVTADAQSRVFGDANPALTYTVGARGLVNGDTLAGNLTTDATPASVAGAYAITQGTLTSVLNPNYAITYAAANLVVNAAPSPTSTPTSTPATPAASPFIVAAPVVPTPTAATISFQPDSTTSVIAPLTVTPVQSASRSDQATQTAARQKADDDIVTGSITSHTFKSADGFVYKPLSQYDAAQYSGDRLPGFESQAGEAAILTMLVRGALGSNDTPRIDNLFEPGRGALWKGANWENPLADRIGVSDGSGPGGAPGETFRVQPGTTDLAALLGKGPMILTGSSSKPSLVSLSLLGVAMTEQGIVANDPGTGRQVLLDYNPETKTLGSVTALFDPGAGTWTRLADVKPDDEGLTQTQLDQLAGLSVDQFAAVSVRR